MLMIAILSAGPIAAVTRRQARQNGWQALYSVHRLPLDQGWVAPGRMEVMAMISAGLSQYREMYPELFKPPFQPIIDPVISLTGSSRYSIKLRWDRTYLVSVDRRGKYVTVRKLVQHQFVVPCALLTATGVLTGSATTLVIGMVVGSLLVLMDFEGFGYMIAECFRRTAAESAGMMHTSASKARLLTQNTQGRTFLGKHGD